MPCYSTDIERATIGRGNAKQGLFSGALENVQKVCA
jgi:hypothetical protein